MIARRFSSDPIRDANNYYSDLMDEEQYCYECERRLSHERALRIRDELYCIECAIDRFGEEIE